MSATRSRRGAVALLAAVAFWLAFAACGSTAEHTNEVLPRPPTAAPTDDSAAAPTSTATPPAEAASILVRARVDGDLLRPVSKQHALGESYAPPDLVTLPQSLVVPGYPERMLRVEAADALSRMVAAAGRDGLQLRVVSAYRSYEEQAFVHDRLAERQGEAEANRRSAPAGHSEHQLGTTVDLSGPSVQWRLTRHLADAPEGRWLAKHAHEHGFALSYPEGAEVVTGYVYEPWHLRYVGAEHAMAWRASNLTLIEYLDSLSPR